MKSILRFLPAILALLAVGPPLTAATVSEPSTLIYGKVLHRSHGNEHRLTEGTLAWTLKDQAGATHTFTVELEDIQGVFSYRIGIPHQALASGLVVEPSAIPLSSAQARYDFVSITVDGSPAALVWSGGDFVNLGQQSRAATHRIDLEVFFDLADTDGDGMPDWWEIENGLDWQTADAHLDPDGDGLSNLAEFRGGSSPATDDRSPTLHTRELAAYGGSDNGVWLLAIDANTPPAGLVYTLTSLPAGGELRLDNGAGNSTVLPAAATFTQEQVNQGRLIYRHTDPAVTASSFLVALSDGVNPPHAAEIAIGVFPPDEESAELADPQQAPDWWGEEAAVFESYWGMRENVLNGDLVESVLLYHLGRNYGWTIWDERAHTLPVTLRAAGPGSHFILGGGGDDVLVGSPQDDILSGGGGTNRLTGGAGRDLFMVNHPGLDILTDFNPRQDVLDLSVLLAGRAGLLRSFLKVVPNGPHSEIRIDQTGGGTTFTDAVVRLENIVIGQDDLHRLWSSGQLLLGDVRGLPAVTFEGWPTESLEEGYSTATLTLRRAGPLDQPLTVSLAISGSATNGVDYQTLPSAVTFAVGENSVALPVNPLPDGISEQTEQIHLSLATGANFVAGALSGSQITVIDAKQRFNLLAVDPVAAVNEDPAYFQIVRQGPRTGVVQLLLSVTGSAVRNVDFAAIPTLVTFADNQASIYVPVQALGLGALAGQEKSRTLTATIRPALGGEYLLGLSPSATIRLLSSLQNFEDWVVEAIPGLDPAASRDALVEVRSPRTGLTALLEYASSYGLVLHDGVDAAERQLLTPMLGRDSGGLHFEFSKRLDDPRLEYVLERSSDLIEWQSDPELFKAIPLTAAQENAGRVRFRVLEPEGGTLPFIRVRVNLKE